MSESTDLAEPEKLRELADDWHHTVSERNEGLCAAAARIESQAAEIAELKAKLTAVTAQREEFLAKKRNNERIIEDLRTQLKMRALDPDHKLDALDDDSWMDREDALAHYQCAMANWSHTLDELVPLRAAHVALKSQLSAAEAEIVKLRAALDELFDGPPETWSDWYERHKHIISSEDPTP